MFRELYRELKKLLKNIAEEPWPVAIIITTIFLFVGGTSLIAVGFILAFLIEVIIVLPQVLFIPVFVVGLVWLIKRYAK